MNIISSNINFNGDFTYNNSPDTIVLHHAEASNCTINDIDSWHKERGWIGVGYHYFVRKDGSIYTGRPENAQGAHCPGYNAHSIGICAEGEYMKETMPDVQKQAIIELCNDLCAKYGFTSIVGHGEVYSTSCPGTNYPLNEIKSLDVTETRATTTYTETTPIDTSSRTWLQVGDSGEDVLIVQQMLKELGFDPNGVDGDYGKKTKNAVFNFQQAIGIPADGLAGNITKTALKDIMAMPLDGVKYAHQEYATRYIQYRVGANVDGVFGDNTAEAVKIWQAANGLTADGVIGPKSWATLI